MSLRDFVLRKTARRDDLHDLMVEAAAKAWFEWQFPMRDWDTASDQMKHKFKDGADLSLQAADLAKKHAK